MPSQTTIILSILLIVLIGGGLFFFSNVSATGRVAGAFVSETTTADRYVNPVDDRTLTIATKGTGQPTSISWNIITGFPTGCPLGYAVQTIDSVLICVAVSPFADFDGNFNQAFFSRMPLKDGNISIDSNMVRDSNKVFVSANDINAGYLFQKIASDGNFTLTDVNIGGVNEQVKISASDNLVVHADRVFGGVWINQDGNGTLGGTDVNVDKNGIYVPIKDFNATNLKRFTDVGDGNILVLNDGNMQFVGAISAFHTPTNNRVYEFAIFVNANKQLNCESEVFFTAINQTKIMNLTCILPLKANDKLTFRLKAETAGDKLVIRTFNTTWGGIID